MPSSRLTSFRLILNFGAALVPFLFSGCAEPALSGTMTAAPTSFATKHTGSVSVTVTGGTTSTTLDASKIVGSDFAKAIEASLKQSGLFAQLVSAGQGEDYQLAAAIVRVDQPVIGRSMTSTVEVNWTLTRVSSKYVFWKKTITSSATVKISEAFSGVDRLRLANEGAARNNIQDTLTQLSALSLP